MCKTKVVCTLGPASRSVEVIEELLRAGMNVARFNFSHGSHEYHKETLDNLRRAMENTKIMCAVMLDTKGPEIRTGTQPLSRLHTCIHMHSPLRSGTLVFWMAMLAVVGWNRTAAQQAMMCCWLLYDVCCAL